MNGMMAPRCRPWRPAPRARARAAGHRDVPGVVVLVLVLLGERLGQQDTVERALDVARASSPPTPRPPPRLEERDLRVAHREPELERLHPDVGVVLPDRLEGHGEERLHVVAMLVVQVCHLPDALVGHDADLLLRVGQQMAFMMWSRSGLLPKLVCTNSRALSIAVQAAWTTSGDLAGFMPSTMAVRISLTEDC